MKKVSSPSKTNGSSCLFIGSNTERKAENQSRKQRAERKKQSEERREEKTMTFEDLESWQQARQLTKQIYSVTREDGIARDFGLCSQIQRAGVSAMSNLARPVK